MCIMFLKAKMLSREDDLFDYGEKRFMTMGTLNESVVVIAHTRISSS